MLIDTHCHLDAAEFDADRVLVADQACEAGVQAIVIPAIERANFAVVRDLAAKVAGGAYALGIHPLAVLIVTIGAGALFGMVGLVLAAPVTSAVVRISADLGRARSAEAPEGRGDAAADPAPA